MNNKFIALFFTVACIAFSLHSCKPSHHKNKSLGDGNGHLILSDPIFALEKRLLIFERHIEIPTGASLSPEIFESNSGETSLYDAIREHLIGNLDNFCASMSPDDICTNNSDARSAVTPLLDKEPETLSTKERYLLLSALGTITANMAKADPTTTQQQPSTITGDKNDRHPPFSAFELRDRLDAAFAKGSTYRTSIESLPQFFKELKKNLHYPSSKTLRNAVLRRDWHHRYMEDDTKKRYPNAFLGFQIHTAKHVYAITDADLLAAHCPPFAHYTKQAYDDANQAIYPLKESPALRTFCGDKKDSKIEVYPLNGTEALKTSLEVIAIGVYRIPQWQRPALVIDDASSPALPSLKKSSQRSYVILRLTDLKTQPRLRPHLLKEITTELAAADLRTFIFPHDQLPGDGNGYDANYHLTFGQLYIDNVLKIPLQDSNTGLLIPTATPQGPLFDANTGAIGGFYFKLSHHFALNDANADHYVFSSRQLLLDLAPFDANSDLGQLRSTFEAQEMKQHIAIQSLAGTSPTSLNDAKNRPNTDEDGIRGNTDSATSKQITDDQEKIDDANIDSKKKTKDERPTITPPNPIIAKERERNLLKEGGTTPIDKRVRRYNVARVTPPSSKLTITRKSEDEEGCRIQQRSRSL